MDEEARKARTLYALENIAAELERLRILREHELGVTAEEASGDPHVKPDVQAVREEHSPDQLSELEEQMRQRAAEAEAEQLEQEISGNLSPEDEELIDLREERLQREAYENALKPGDRVRKPDGTTATVATSPMYYEQAKGHLFTGWAVEIELDEPPEVSLARVERGFKPSREFALLERLTLIADHPE